MDITLLTYDRPHWKTERFLQELVAIGHRPVRIIASPCQKLDVPPAARTTVKQIPRHPRKLAARYGIPYRVKSHNTIAGTDLGIIGGARILPCKVIARFGVGILNMHPGVLPYNRGLSNITRAIRDELPQGITAHLIDEHIDAGWLLRVWFAPIEVDDTILDVGEKIMDLQVVHLGQAINLAIAGDCTELSHVGGYQRPMKRSDEERLIEGWHRRRRV